MTTIRLCLKCQSEYKDVRPIQNFTLSTCERCRIQSGDISLVEVRDLDGSILRDGVASEILKVIIAISDPRTLGLSAIVKSQCRTAYAYADAMLEVRKEK